MHSLFRWSVIASRLPGRTDNEIKNYWNTHIKKKLLKIGIDPVTHKSRLDLLQLYSILNSSLYNTNSNSQSQINVSTLVGIGSILNPNMLNLANFLPPQDTSRIPQTQIQNDQLIQGSGNGAEFLNETTQYLQPNYFSGLELANYEISSQPVMTDHSCENLSNFGFGSLMSTPSSNVTSLHSSSTIYVNGCTEDERNSYGSNMLMIDM